MPPQPKPYLRMSMDGIPGPVVTLEEAKKELDGLMDECEGEESELSFKLVFMTSEEYRNLPEFEGF